MTAPYSNNTRFSRDSTARKLVRGAAPQPASQQPGGPRSLRSVTAPPRTRWITTLGSLAFCVIAAVLFGLAILNAVIVQQQRSIDEVTTELNSAAARNEQLKVELTGLEAPDRILTLASEELGMIAVEPSEVRYLTAAHGELNSIFVASTIDAAGR